VTLSEDLHLISGLDLDTALFGVFVIKCSGDAIAIVSIMPPVLHKLNIFAISQPCRASLRPIWHNSDLLIRFLVSYSDGRDNWVEIGGNVVGVREGVLFSVPQLSLVHIKSIRINVEGLSGVNTNKLPVYHHIFAPSVFVLFLVELFTLMLLLLLDGDFIEGYLELDELRVLRKLDHCHYACLDPLFILLSVTMAHIIGLLVSNQELPRVLTLSDLNSLDVRVQL